MSGPKVSIYDLTGWARQVVEGQIRCENQAIVCGEQIKQILSQCSGMRGSLEKSLQMLNLFQSKYGGQEQTIAEVKNLMQNLEREIQSIQSEYNKNIPTISPKYRISDEAYEQKKHELERILAIKKIAEDLKKELDKAANAGKDAGVREQKKTNQKIAEYLNDGDEAPANPLEGRNLQELEKSISNDISGSFSFDSFEEEPKQKSLDDAKKELFNELAELLKLELPKSLLDEIKNALTNLDKIDQMSRLTSFESITVKKIFKDIEKYQIECEKEEAAFAEQVLRYKTLCDMAHLEAEKNRSFKDTAELEEAIHEMELAVVKQKEQAYIADCVDEVMQDMGYDLIGKREVTKKSGKHFKNELYQFGEGTAVNITYSSEGQISMELGGIAREDRVPTADETPVLTQDMQTFCGEFAEFEKRMKAKGVIVGNRIALMPPEAEYAAIINVSDYNVEPGKQITEMNVASTKKKTATAQKVLRRDE